MWLFISIKYHPIEWIFNRFLVPERDFRGNKESNISSNPHSSVPLWCQFYHLGWINCESDSSKKKVSKEYKKIWSAKALALSSTINHHWHDRQTNTWHRRDWEGGHSSFTCIVHFLTVLLNNKEPTESVTEQETLNTDELHPSPQQTAANRRSCTSEL